MAKIQDKGTTKVKVKKRPYIIDTEQKVKAGKPWKLGVDLDPDVGLKLLEESKTIPYGYRAYSFLVNNRLRMAYKLKVKKAK